MISSGEHLKIPIIFFSMHNTHILASNYQTFHATLKEKAVYVVIQCK